MNDEVQRVTTTLNWQPMRAFPTNIYELQRITLCARVAMSVLLCATNVINVQIDINRMAKDKKDNSEKHREVNIKTEQKLRPR